MQTEMRILTAPNGIQVACINSAVPVVTDGQSALDLMMTVQYETGCNRLVLNKGALDEKFFVLSSGLAGDVLQKFINYHCKLAIWGDFSGYTSKPLRDFIFESNSGKDIFFMRSVQQAVQYLSEARA